MAELCKLYWNVLLINSVDEFHVHLSVTFATLETRSRSTSLVTRITLYGRALNLYRDVFLINRQVIGQCKILECQDGCNNLRNIPHPSSSPQGGGHGESAPCYF